MLSANAAKQMAKPKSHFARRLALASVAAIAIQDPVEGRRGERARAEFRKLEGDPNFQAGYRADMRQVIAKLNTP